MKPAINPKRRLTHEQISGLTRCALSKLLYALENANPPPCVECEMWEYCAKHEAACVDFWNYISGAKNRRERSGRVPTKAIYRKCYPETDEDDTKGAAA